MSEVKKILDERGARYGEFYDVSKTTIDIQRLLHRGRITREYQVAALQMISSKLARIVNGDPDYIDNWVDIAGYAQLVVDELKKMEG